MALHHCHERIFTQEPKEKYTATITAGTEREYSQEMDEVIKCEKGSITFDSTTLDILMDYLMDWLKKSLSGLPHFGDTFFSFRADSN